VKSAVLDANTVVSENLVKEGIPSQILDAARAGVFVLITSTVIIDEVLRALRRSRVQRKYRVTETDTFDLRALLERTATVTPITAEVHGVATHPEDDLILATVASAGADYLVTGDR
jgi:putative PIN family toxin of toxin-antitoxin system